MHRMCLFIVVVFIIIFDFSFRSKSELKYSSTSFVKAGEKCCAASKKTKLNFIRSRRCYTILLWSLLSIRCVFGISTYLLRAYRCNAEWNDGKNQPFNCNLSISQWKKKEEYTATNNCEIKSNECGGIT